MQWLTITLLALLSLAATVESSRRSHHHGGSDRATMLRGNRTPKSKAKHDLDSFLDTCSECKLIVGKIKDVLEDKTKIAEIKSVLLILCDTLGSKAEECKTVVNNLDEIIEDIKPFLGNATYVCQQLYLCGGSSKKYAKIAKIVMMVARKELDRFAESKNSLMCDECKFAVVEARTLLSDKGTQGEIKIAFHQLCSYLGGVSEQCDDLVDQYLPDLFAMLENYLKDEKALCSEFGLCDAKRTIMIPRVPLILAEGGERTIVDPSVTIPRPLIQLARFKKMLRHLQTEEGYNVACLLCKYGLKEATIALDNDFVRRQIVGAVESAVCNVLKSHSNQHKCKTFMTIYLNTFIEMALHYMKNPKICKEMHICKKADLHHILKSKMATDERNSQLCSSCKLITEFVGNELSQQSLQDEVVELLNQYVCTTMPKSYVGQCKEMVSDFVPGVMNAASAYLQKDTFCNMIGLCSSESTDVDIPEKKSSEESDEDMF